MFDITDQDEELPDMSPQITRRLHQNSVPRSIGKSPNKGLKRRGTDPSMNKQGMHYKPVKEPAKINGDSVFYTDSSYLNVPMISRDRSSPSIGSNLSDPESCLDGCVFDDDDESILGLNFRHDTSVATKIPRFQKRHTISRLPTITSPPLVKFEEDSTLPLELKIMTAEVDEEEQDQIVSETTPLKIVVGPSRSMSHTPPAGVNISPTHFSPPPHVLHNRAPVSAVPGRLINHKKQLRKYASETCFATRPAIQPDQPSGTGTSSTRNNSDESVPSSGRDIKSSTRVYHVRPVPATVRTSNGKTVINKINRRRQDSDDVSGSIASETTIASGPTTPKNVRLKLKRPKSTGNMGYTNHIYGDGTMNSAGTVTVYDPSYTSATIHSFDSQQQNMLVPVETERRASNFYMDDDSLHEFDDDGNVSPSESAAKRNMASEKG